MDTSGPSQNEPGGAQFHGALGGALADPQSPSWRAAWLLRQAESRRKALRESERERFWYAVKVVCICWLGAVAGLISMAWGLHTTDPVAGRVAFVSGQAGGSAIIVVTLVIAWLRWEREDW